MLPQVITSPPNDKEVSEDRRKKAERSDPDADSDDSTDLICGCLGCGNPAYARVRHPKHGSVIVCSDASCKQDYDILEVLS